MASLSPQPTLIGFRNREMKVIFASRFRKSRSQQFFDSGWVSLKKIGSRWCSISPMNCCNHYLLGFVLGPFGPFSNEAAISQTLTTTSISIFITAFSIFFTREKSIAVACKSVRPPSVENDSNESTLVMSRMQTAAHPNLPAKIIG